MAAGSGGGDIAGEEGRKPREGENDSTRNSCRSGTRFLLGTAYLVATKLNNRNISWPAREVSLVRARISRPRIQRDSERRDAFSENRKRIV